MHRQDGWQQEIGVLYFENKQNRMDAYMTPGYTVTQFCMTGMPLLFLVCKKKLDFIHADGLSSAVKCIVKHSRRRQLMVGIDDTCCGDAVVAVVTCRVGDKVAS